MNEHLLLPEANTPIEVLRLSVERYPDSIAVDFSGDVYSYRDVHQRSSRLAHYLRSLGIIAGETVVTFMDTCPDALFLWFAINELGAIWVPVNTANRGEFLRHQISDSHTAVVICDASYLERFEGLLEELPLLRYVCVKDLDQTVARSGVSSLVIALPQNLDAYPAYDPAVSMIPEDISCLIYTSGTTGKSKGCMVSGSYMCNFARQTLAAFPQKAEDVSWCSLPLFHMAALCNVVLPTMLVGGRCSLSAKFSVSGFWDEVERSGATIVTLIGSMFDFIAEAVETDVSVRCTGRLSAAVGGPASPEIQRIWRERFGVGYINVYGYGQTEGCKITSVKFGDAPSPPSSAGHIIDDFDVKIFDDADNEVPVGQSGEIVYRPRRPNIMFSGYWNNATATSAAWRNLWMHSGDIGRLDENGYLYWLDRKKDYVRRRGENISSSEMEATLLRHPDVAEVAYHAIPSDSAEDEVKITVVLRTGSCLSEKDLCRWMLEKVPYFAVPRYIEFRLELPRTATGRVQKFILRDQGATNKAWDREVSDIVIVR